MGSAYGPGPQAAAALLTDAGRDAEVELAAGAVLPGARASNKWGDARASRQSDLSVWSHP